MATYCRVWIISGGYRFLIAAVRLTRLPGVPVQLPPYGGELRLQRADHPAAAKHLRLPEDEDRVYAAPRGVCRGHLLLHCFVCSCDCRCICLVRLEEYSMVHFVRGLLRGAYISFCPEISMFDVKFHF